MWVCKPDVPKDQERIKFSFTRGPPWGQDFTRLNQPSYDLLTFQPTPECRAVQGEVFPPTDRHFLLPTAQPRDGWCKNYNILSGSYTTKIKKTSFQFAKNCSVFQRNLSTGLWVNGSSGRERKVGDKSLDYPIFISHFFGNKISLSCKSFKLFDTTTEPSHQLWNFSSTKK